MNDWLPLPVDDIAMSLMTVLPLIRTSTTSPLAKPRKVTVTVPSAGPDVGPTVIVETILTALVTVFGPFETVAL